MANNYALLNNGVPLTQNSEEYEGQDLFVKNFSGTIFTLGNFDDMVRVQIGQRDPRDLKPCRCFALKPQTQPLIDEFVWNDGSIAPLAYQNFRWCGVLSSVITLHNDRYHIPGFLPENKRTYPDRLFFIYLRYDEDVFVADVNAGKKYFAECSSFSGRLGLTGIDLEESYRVMARTLIPIKFYRGQFAEPTILVKRELLFNEVKYIKSFNRR